MMERRKLQLYVTDHQYRLLKQRAGERGSIAKVVRDLIDQASEPADPASDPFYRHVVSEKTGSGTPYSAEQAKRELYRQSS
jgi:hypothetical protein